MEYISLEEAQKISLKDLKEMLKFYNEYWHPVVGAVELPILIWRKMGFNTAGRATYSSKENNKKSLIEMNINFLQSKDAKKFIHNTLAHELAHIIAFRDFNSRGHDRYWREVAYRLGDDGERLHDYSTPENKPKKEYYQLTCKCGLTHEFTARRFKNVGRYFCSKCHQNMEDVLYTLKKVYL